MPTPCVGEVGERLRGIRSRTCSRKVSTTAGATPVGQPLGLDVGVGERDAECASTSVRRPVEASSVTRAARAALRGRIAASPNTISGRAEHPRPTAVCERDRAPLAGRRERHVGLRPQGASGGPGTARAGMRAVAFASGAAPYQASACSQPGDIAHSSGCERRSDVALVSVPVLSRQITSTRARALHGRQLVDEHLLAGELRRADGEGDQVIRTSPSGIIATSARRSC